MKKLLKIIVYCVGIGMVVGAGVWAELNSGTYPHLQNKDGKVSVKDILQRKSARN